MCGTRGMGCGVLRDGTLRDRALIEICSQMDATCWRLYFQSSQTICFWVNCFGMTQLTYHLGFSLYNQVFAFPDLPILMLTNRVTSPVLGNRYDETAYNPSRSSSLVSDCTVVDHGIATWVVSLIHDAFPCVEKQVFTPHLERLTSHSSMKNRLILSTAVHIMMSSIPIIRA